MVLGDKFNGVLDELAIYERELSQERLQAHVAAAALGFDAASTGERIGQALALLDVFPAWNIRAGARNMPPARYAGREPAEMIDEAVEAEGLPALFFFSRAGVPTFLGADYRDAAPFNTPSFTFGSAGLGHLEAASIHIADADAFLYNEIRAIREGGDTTFTAADQVSRDRFGELVLPLDALPLANDADTQAYADDLLAKYKDPMVRIDSFAVAEADAERRHAILTIDQQDCVRVEFQPSAAAPRSTRPRTWSAAASSGTARGSRSLASSLSPRAKRLPTRIFRPRHIARRCASGIREG